MKRPEYLTDEVIILSVLLGAILFFGLGGSLYQYQIGGVKVLRVTEAGHDCTLSPAIVGISMSCPSFAINIGQSYNLTLTERNPNPVAWPTIPHLTTNSSVNLITPGDNPKTIPAGATVTFVWDVKVIGPGNGGVDLYY